MVINMVGDFKNPWLRDPDQEKRRITANARRKAGQRATWYPSTEDWTAVFNGKQTLVSSFSQFLGTIQKQKTNTIDRINLFSHGGDGLLAFSGDITGSSDGTATCFLSTKDGLDEDAITNVEPIYVPPKQGTSQPATLIDRPGQTARLLCNRFVPAAEIVFYLCDSGRGGLGSQLLQEVANAFLVTTRGFSGPVTCCCEWWEKPGSKIERGFTALPPGDCATKKHGFSHLKPDATSKGFKIPLARKTCLERLADIGASDPG